MTPIPWLITRANRANTTRLFERQNHFWKKKAFYLFFFSIFLSRSFNGSYIWLALHLYTFLFKSVISNIFENDSSVFVVFSTWRQVLIGLYIRTWPTGKLFFVQVVTQTLSNLKKIYTNTQPSGTGYKRYYLSNGFNY